ncbi:hypothetical protein GON03_03355 [Nocardioides sp. MAH-18]|uniref:Uncharacterized protein n=2 Tax=Nocardioidaceae TaxID=85015 RepID=A0A6L6XRH8_9ACTN|nr:hypothetical protein [Nocardioides sp. CGMCC 1.13656]MVQ48205.1 hypothetical protein [Nocardioides sp. MAH-18]
MRFTDSAGRTSKAYYDEVATCPEDPVTATLPEVNQSYDRLLKPVGIKYLELPVTFRAVKKAAADASCSFRGSGVLHVRIRLGAGYDRNLPQRRQPDLVVESHATAQLDFLDGSASIPDCRWALFGPRVSGCVVGGVGSGLVRWHTAGFSELLAGKEVYNSGPFTFYARFDPSMTYQRAIKTVEPLLHVELSHNLDSMRWFYAIQDPPANVAVVDSAGRVTGQLAHGPAREQIPGSVYFAHKGFSGILLMRPNGQRYEVRITDDHRSRFKLSMVKVVPQGTLAHRTRDIRKVGVVGVHHPRTYCLLNGKLC